MSHIIEISSFDAPELDIYARTSENQLVNRANPAEAMFIAESPRVIERALDAGYEPVSCLVEKRQLAGEARTVLERLGNIPVYTAEMEVLAQLTGFKLTRGMLCAMYRKALPSVREVCGNARRIAILENVVNPTNVGAIFRSAAALHMDAVLLTFDCSNPLYRRAVRVSMGTVFQIPWTYIENNVKELGEWGFKTAAMSLCEHAVSIDDQALMAEGRLALVFGTEGYGLSQAAIDACDYVVKIPMEYNVDSLNVAAASAVAFWQLRCQQ